MFRIKGFSERETDGKWDKFFRLAIFYYEVGVMAQP